MAQGSGPAEAVSGEDEDDLPQGEMSDSPQLSAQTAAVLTGLVLVPGSVWLELSPVRRPSIRWQVEEEEEGPPQANCKLATIRTYAG